MPKKYTINEIKMMIVEIHPDINVISDEYFGNDGLLKCKCNIDGYEWDTSWKDLKRNANLCPVCNDSKRMNIDVVKLKMKNINPDIEILDSSYIDSGAKLKCKCKVDGFEWKTKWNHLKAGHGCPKCKYRNQSKNMTLTIGEIKKKLNEINKNIEILSEEYIGSKQKLKCRCLIDGYVWTATWSNLSKERGCPCCAKVKRRVSQSFTLEQIKEKLKFINPDAIIISDEYKNCKEKLKCKCLIDGNEWFVSWDNLSRGRGCPQCSESRGERKIRQYLENQNIEFKQEYSFDDLLGIGGQSLRFDFAIFDNNDNLKFLIEYDGEFHFEKYYESQNFKELQIHDKLKNEYCQNNNINLIRIPYWEYDEIEKILDDILI